MGVNLKSILGFLYHNDKKVLTEGEGVVLSGQDLTDVGIIGTNPEATKYPDGSIVGSSDNGSFTKFANGNVTAFNIISGTVDINVALGNIYRTSNITAPSFPITLTSVESKSYSVTSSNTTNVWNTTSAGDTDTSWDIFRLQHALSSTGVTYRMSLSVKGRYK